MLLKLFSNLLFAPPLIPKQNLLKTAAAAATEELTVIPGQTISKVHAFPQNIFSKKIYEIQMIRIPRLDILPPPPPPRETLTPVTF